MKNRSILFVACLLISKLSNAQNLSLFGVLPAISQTGAINKKFNYNLFVSTTIDAFDVKLNNVDYPSSDYQLYIQPSLIYTISPNFNVAASYTYSRSNPFLESYTNEHRVWQQAIYSFALSKVKVTNRLRFEERFIQDRKTGDYPLRTRLRYQLGFNMPLQGRTLDKHEFYVNAYNEFYFSLTGNKNATFSENWTYAGVGYNLGNMGKLELGYLLQTSVRDLQQDLRFFNLAQVMWVTNFNFFKKKTQ